MQSGQAKDDWVLEYEPERPREIDPLMGWTSSSDMKSQLTLKFRLEGAGGGLCHTQRHPLPRRGAEAGHTQGYFLL